MKLFASLLLAAHSEEVTRWMGQSSEDPCGMILTAGSPINTTCTLNGANIKYKFFGNGAFIDATSITGYDGISGDASVVVYFDMLCDEDGNCSNETCWDADLSCAPVSGRRTGTLFMDTVNDFRNKGGAMNLQVSGVEAGDSLTFILLDHDDAPFAVKNISTPFGEVTQADSNTFNVQVGDAPFGELFQITIVDDDNEGVLNLWHSTVRSS